MPLLLGFVLAIAMGILAVFAVTWTGRYNSAAKRQDVHLQYETEV